MFATVKSLDKISLYHSVQGEWIDDTDIWYLVGFKKDEELKKGYIHSSLGTPRNFRFDRMKDAINELIHEVNQGELHYISNYRNQNGAPPQVGNSEVDEYGYRVYHSAPAYKEANKNSGYRYVPDVILVRILGETYPRSSMCVRNYTSHAEFFYNWMDTKNGAVIVIE